MNLSFSKYLYTKPHLTQHQTLVISKKDVDSGNQLLREMVILNSNASPKNLNNSFYKNIKIKLSYLKRLFVLIIQIAAMLNMTYIGSNLNRKYGNNIQVQVRFKIRNVHSGLNHQKI